jgi:predicted transcriptional regulator YdeE
MRVACYRVISQAPEQDAARSLKAWLGRQNVSSPSRHYGFEVEVTSNLHKDDIRGYEVWMTVPADVKSSEGVIVEEFPGGLYAVMTLNKPFDTPFVRIPNGWRRLHAWVIESDHYRGANHQWLEEIIPQEDGDDLKLYHPILITASGIFSPSSLSFGVIMKAVETL